MTFSWSGGGGSASRARTAEPGSSSRGARRRGRAGVREKYQGLAGHRISPTGPWMVEFDEHLPDGHMRIGGDLGGVPYGADWHLAAQSLEDLRFGSTMSPCGERREHLVPTCDAQLVGCQARVGGKVGAVDELAELAPATVVGCCDGDPAVGGRQDVERAQQRVPVALRVRHRAGVGVLVDDSFAQGEYGVVHRDVNELPAPAAACLVERRGDAERQHGAGEDIADARADLDRGSRPRCR